MAALTQQDLFRLRPAPIPKIHYSFANALNLDADGSLLRYTTAMKGPDAAHLRIAEAEEFDRLFLPALCTQFSPQLNLSADARTLSITTHNAKKSRRLMVANFAFEAQSAATG